MTRIYYYCILQAEKFLLIGVFLEDSALKVLERIDEELPSGVAFTRKVMENGEIRERVKFPDGTSISQTTAENWPLDTPDLPWQDPHSHGGLVEVYTLIKGLAAFIWKDGKAPSCLLLREPGATISFLPQVPHLVLLGPEARISTLLFAGPGGPMSNPYRKGNDWWPASLEFVREIAETKLAVEHLIR